MVSCGVVGENRTGEVVDHAISVIFAEMALFTKTPEVCRTELYRLLYIFKRRVQLHTGLISESGGVV